MKEKTFAVSVGAYVISFVLMYVWDALPQGTVFSSIVFGLVIFFIAVGAVSAGVLNAEDWDEGLSDEEYEELYQMIMERKRQLEENKCEI